MFAENLKRLRKAKGLTQTQFASEFSISSGTIAMWETGKRMPDTDMLRKIAQFFNVSIDYLLDNEKSPSEESEGLDKASFAVGCQVRLRGVFSRWTKSSSGTHTFISRCLSSA